MAWVRDKPRAEREPNWTCATVSEGSFSNQDLQHMHPPIRPLCDFTLYAPCSDWQFSFPGFLLVFLVAKLLGPV